MCGGSVINSVRAQGNIYCLCGHVIRAVKFREFCFGTNNTKGKLYEPPAPEQNFAWLNSLKNDHTGSEFNRRTREEDNA